MGFGKSVDDPWNALAIELGFFDINMVIEIMTCQDGHLVVLIGRGGEQADVSQQSPSEGLHQ